MREFEFKPVAIPVRRTENAGPCSELSDRYHTLRAEMNTKDEVGGGFVTGTVFGVTMMLMFLAVMAIL